jgi:hypothetical protein
MQITSGRDEALMDAQESEFFGAHGHLAYRYTMLWTHKLRFPQNHGLEHCHTICAFEASLLACRVFLEFLGLRIRLGTEGPVLEEQRPEDRRPDDVRVTDLGGSFARLADISVDNRRLLAKVYYMANKANAHLTHGASFMDNASIVHDAIPVIDRLFRTHLFEPVGKEPSGHWDRLPTPGTVLSDGAVEAGTS